MITLSCGTKIKPRPFNYVLDWLKEHKDEQMPIFLHIKFNQKELKHLDNSQFWELFHIAANEEMQGKI